ncbi:MAG: U32 family peptidase [Deltaproteobacteria bacterium]|nr:U32 family peptidase [Deltaproteobacteria bacterium]
MKLSIATNWTADLIAGLAPYPVADVYGSLPTTPVGSGRPAMFLPPITKEAAAEHIQLVHRKGMRFNYLFNGMCIGKRDFNAVERDLLPQLEWVQSLGVTLITVAHPTALGVVKKHCPQIRVKMSILSDFDSVQKVKALEQLGADDIALSIMFNRDFAFLDAVARATSCGLTLLLNQACLYMCAHRLNHGAINAHASLADAENDGFGINYVLMKCAIEKLQDPAALIKSRVIRPEDLPVYEALGYDTFKIAGREMDTPWLVNTARAYSQKRYDGNFCDLLNGVAVMMGSGHANRRMPFIDNRALDGFITRFTDGRCSGRCDDCGYCAKWASRSVNLFSGDNAALIDTLCKMKEMML